MQILQRRDYDHVVDVDKFVSMESLLAGGVWV